MKKLLLSASLVATSLSANAFTKTQAEDLHIKQVTATCISPITNKSTKYFGSPSSIYISNTTGLLVVKTSSSVLTISPSYCVITGTR